MLTLYDYFRSSACFRVRIALNLKGLKYEIKPIHLLKNGGEQFSASYRQINSQMLVPSLQDETKTLTQSLAIIEYINDTHPTPPLLPESPYEKALARAFALAIVADLHPLNNQRVLKYLTQTFTLSEEEKNAWYQHWIMKGLTALEEQMVKQQLSGDFCFGDTPTLADICLVPQMFNARRFQCDLQAYPHLVRIDANCQQHPAFLQAWPTEAVETIG